ncbi:Very-short-patch-repair endonuclease [Algoriphagus hitonicola]|uniref:Very-short-patch-repair endonuclease n=2 Tax=Algoriphagus hitonicola TaxID=435880 RepID=A0A1I2TGT5_9BACT|nr:Very-short-patch-repair endonuclease [Algoriphagus hitonicola]
MTMSEKILWEKLKGKSLNGSKFRGQHPIDKYIVDFYCHSAKLVIELDGSIHELEEQKEYDLGRTSELQELGLKILRFKNEEVLDTLNLVLKRITEALK